MIFEMSGKGDAKSRAASSFLRPLQLLGAEESRIPELLERVKSQQMLMRPIEQSNERSSKSCGPQVKNKRRRLQSTQPLSARRQRILGLAGKRRLERAMHFEQLLPLHQLWCEYSMRVLASPQCSEISQMVQQQRSFRRLSSENTSSPSDRAMTANASSERAMIANTLSEKALLEVAPPIERKSSDILMAVLKMDLHGALITVQRSSCPSRVGLCGICIQESKNAFIIVAKDDQTRQIPKEGTLFRITLPVGPIASATGSAAGSMAGSGKDHSNIALSPDLAKSVTVDIVGSNFTMRAAVRSAFKFKKRCSIDV